MTFFCPSCNYELRVGVESCPQCLLVIEKYEKKKLGLNSNVEASLQLKKIWDEILLDYGNRTIHEKFLQVSLQENNLTYASQQYKNMLHANSTDDIALKMREKIIQLATATYVPPARPSQNQRLGWGMKALIFILFILFASGLLQAFFS